MLKFVLTCAFCILSSSAYAGGSFGGGAMTTGPSTNLNFEVIKSTNDDMTILAEALLESSFVYSRDIESYVLPKASDLKFNVVYAETTEGETVVFVRSLRKAQVK